MCPLRRSTDQAQVQRSFLDSSPRWHIASRRSSPCGIVRWPAARSAPRHLMRPLRRTARGSWPDNKWDADDDSKPLPIDGALAPRPQEIYTDMKWCQDLAVYCATLAGADLHTFEAR